MVDGGFKVAETNMAGIGGAGDKALRKRAAQTEAAWQVMSLGEGVQVWRVEKLKIRAWPQEKYGEFYDGDAYIILNAAVVKKSKAIKYTIFFWLGKYSSIDEQAVAAYKTVELASLLDGKAAQLREVQLQESGQFRDLFPDGIQYLSGGIESGLKNIDKRENFDSHLIRLFKGKRGVEKKQVPVEKESMNQKDCFILDAGRQIYTWHGENANALVKYEAAAESSRLENKKGEFCYVSKKLDDRFWKILGGEGTIKPEDTSASSRASVNGLGSGGASSSAAAAAAAPTANVTLYRCIVTEGRMERVASTGLDPSMLDSRFIMVLDRDETGEIFIWRGKQTADDNTAAMRVIKKFLAETERSIQSVSVKKLEEGKTIKDKTWNSFFPPNR